MSASLSNPRVVYPPRRTRNKRAETISPCNASPLESRGGEPTRKQRVGCPLIGQRGFKAHVTNKALASAESPWQDAGVPFGARPWPRQRANMTWTRAFCGRINHLPKVPSHKKAKSVVRPAKYLWCTKVLKSSPFFSLPVVVTPHRFSNVFTLCFDFWTLFGSAFLSIHSLSLVWLKPHSGTAVSKRQLSSTISFCLCLNPTTEYQSLFFGIIKW